MSFDEIQFPASIARGSSGGPQFATVVVAAGSGGEQRVAQWESPRRRWTVAQDLRTPAQMEELVAFFVARQGRLRGFRFKDHADFRVSTREDLVELTATTFQLVRRYTSGGVTRVRTIKKPVAGTVQIWNGTTEITSGWTVDTTTGVVTFGGDPGYTPSWTGEFDVPVRFDVDQMEIVLDDAQVRSWGGIAIVELRP